MRYANNITTQTSVRRGLKFVTQEDPAAENSFRWFLELEKRRSQRNGGTVCMLSLSFSASLFGAQQRTKLKPADEFWHSLLESIMFKARESDIVFSQDGKIKIIFTNTLKDGAYIASKRIFRAIQGLIKEQENGLKSRRPRFEMVLSVWDYGDKYQYQTVIFGKEPDREVWTPIIT